MTMVIWASPWGLCIMLFGGTAEFAQAVNNVVPDTVESGLAFARSR